MAAATGPGALCSTSSSNCLPAFPRATRQVGATCSGRSRNHGHGRRPLAENVDVVPSHKGHPRTLLVIRRAAKVAARRTRVLEYARGGRLSVDPMFALGRHTLQVESQSASRDCRNER